LPDTSRREMLPEFQNSFAVTLSSEVAIKQLKGSTTRKRLLN